MNILWQSYISKKVTAGIRGGCIGENFKSEYSKLSLPESAGLSNVCLNSVTAGILALPGKNNWGYRIRF